MQFCFRFAGDKLEIEFEIYINKSTVIDLNSGKEKLEDILILHLVGGEKCQVILQYN